MRCISAVSGSFGWSSPFGGTTRRQYPSRKIVDSNNSAASFGTKRMTLIAKHAIRQWKEDGGRSRDLTLGGHFLLEPGEAKMGNEDQEKIVRFLKRTPTIDTLRFAYVWFDLLSDPILAEHLNSDESAIANVEIMGYSRNGADEWIHKMLAACPTHLLQPESSVVDLQLFAQSDKHMDYMAALGNVLALKRDLKRLRIFGCVVDTLESYKDFLLGLKAQDNLKSFGYYNWYLPSDKTVAVRQTLALAEVVSEHLRNGAIKLIKVRGELGKVPRQKS
uniref:Uncharacterized protein n=1 Tax=Entomoneis paludosa TaxID=265537 RepID=A0A7S2V8Y2_9STRA|mmetsp:Transcript_12587/g.26069  ORF Transcript_12587/g.26069 Transcript_12587/m.26069 type:complete len:276 (+) Transcript_12587:348-1175(+)